MKFENSRYSAFWQSGEMLKTYIDMTPYLRTNFNFWESQFDVDPALTPTDDKGVAAFSMQSVIRKPSPMMDMVAPLGRGKTLENEGLSVYTATIPHFRTPSYHETAFERAAKQKMFEQFGSDAELIKQWSHEVQSMLDSANQTLSNMSAQLISTGEIDYQYGRMIKNYLYSANLPENNIVKAGTNIWSASECKLLDQMAKIEQDFREVNGYDNIPMKWQIPYDMFVNVFLKNAQVRKLVEDYRTNNQLATTTGFIITEEIFRKVVALYPQISPIEVIVERQNNFGTKVHGWKQNVAVLRPQGRAGVIKHTDQLEEFMAKNFAGNAVSKVYTHINSLFTLVNATLNNGEYKEWHTDMLVSAIPALDEVPYHLIVKTDESGDGKTTL